VLCFPFARLYELGGRTIWAPTLLHAAIQAPKVATFDDSLFPVLWMVAGMIIAWCAFLIPSPR
jgi:hypothetical protein